MPSAPASSGRSSVAGCCAGGEAANTHGVMRPGGEALNAGQIFGTRMAEHAAASGRAKTFPAFDAGGGAEAAIADLRDMPRPAGAFTVRSVPSKMQARMIDKGGMTCDAVSLGEAPARAQALHAEFSYGSIACKPASETVRSLQRRRTALASEAVHAAFARFIRNGESCCGGVRALRDGGIRDADRDRQVLRPLCRRDGGRRFRHLWSDPRSRAKNGTLPDRPKWLRAELPLLAPEVGRAAPGRRCSRPGGTFGKGWPDPSVRDHTGHPGSQRARTFSRPSARHDAAAPSSRSIRTSAGSCGRRTMKSVQRYRGWQR